MGTGSLYVYGFCRFRGKTRPLRRKTVFAVASITIIDSARKSVKKKNATCLKLWKMRMCVSHFRLITNMCCGKIIWDQPTITCNFVRKPNFLGRCCNHKHLWVWFPSRFWFHLELLICLDYDKSSLFIEVANIGFNGRPVFFMWITFRFVYINCTSSSDFPSCSTCTYTRHVNFMCFKFKGGSFPKQQCGLGG